MNAVSITTGFENGGDLVARTWIIDDDLAAQIATMLGEPIHTGLMPRDVAELSANSVMEV